MRVGEPIEHLATYGCACDGGGDDPHAMLKIHDIARAFALPQIQSKADEVGEAFKQPMRVESERAELEANGKLHWDW